MLGVDCQVVLDDIVLLDAVLYEEGETLDVEHDVVLQQEVRHSVDGRGAVERVVHRATSRIRTFKHALVP